MGRLAQLAGQAQLAEGRQRARAAAERLDALGGATPAPGRWPGRRPARRCARRRPPRRRRRSSRGRRRRGGPARPAPAPGGCGRRRWPPAAAAPARWAPPAPGPPRAAAASPPWRTAPPSPGSRVASRDEAGRGVLDLDEPLLAHLEDAGLVGGAEAVLQRPQRAVGALALALEAQHAVHQVLEHARARQRALLGHVAHQDHGRALRCLATRISRPATSRTWPTEPGEPRQRRRRRAPGPSRSTHDLGPLGLDRGDHGVEVGLGHDRHPQRGRAEPLGAQPDLGGRLLARHVEHLAAGGGQVAERRRGDRGLADARRAAEQHQRAGHEAAAEHAVELADAGAHARARPAPRPRRAARAAARGPPGGASRPGLRAAGARASSASVFHSPQPGQRPCHLGLSWPQAEQTKTRSTWPSAKAKPRPVTCFARRGLAIRPADSAIGACQLGRCRVPGRRHRDQRARRRPLRAHRGRRRAGGRRRVPRHLGVARAGGAPAARAASSASPASPRRWWTPRRPPSEVLPELAELLEGRVLVAHNARFDIARAAPGVRARRARLARPAGALHGRPGPPLRPAGAAARAGRLADALGIEVDEVHRALPDALTCARVFCACSPGCAPTPSRWPTPWSCCAPAPARAQDRAGARSRARSAPTSRGCPTTPASTSSATSAAGRSTSASRCRCARRARAHFCAPAGWTERAEIVDYRPTNSELGALVLENRLIKQSQPAGQPQAQAHATATSTCAAGSTSPTRCSRSPPSRRPATP